MPIHRFEFKRHASFSDLKIIAAHFGYPCHLELTMMAYPGDRAGRRRTARGQSARSAVAVAAEAASGHDQGYLLTTRVTVVVRVRLPLTPVMVST